MKKYFDNEEEAKTIYYYAHKHSSEIFVKEYIKPAEQKYSRDCQMVKFNSNDYITNTRYIVTKQSNDETLVIGDQITLNENGILLNHTARGWLDAKEVAEAMQGLEVKIDKEYYQNMKINLENQLMKINTKLLLAKNEEKSV